MTLLLAGDILLTPAKMYSPSLLPVLRSGHVKAFAFVAEEGLLEGISRILPEHVSAVLGKYQRWAFLFNRIYIQHWLDFSASVVTRSQCFSKEPSKNIPILSKHQLMSITLSLEKGNLRRVWRQLISERKGILKDCVFCETPLHTEHFDQTVKLVERTNLHDLLYSMCTHTYTHTHLMQLYGRW